jgi:hypothetical protein
MERTTRARWPWVSGIGYVLLLAAVLWALLAAREWALTVAASPQSLREWQAWRQDVEQQRTERVPVQRRVPKSIEPPALVLMRDYFAVCLVGAIVFSSLLYWVVAWFIHGISAAAPEEDSQRKERRPESQ